ncbi:DUF1344 domain-containing protein [Pararhizobium sp. IMCC21322]|uniref:DUF1344 domain-containing protein n=1 Tax=Pararhizobium sp. IMCC21322 TaxID=3067903 RepID=UPI0027403BBE|nr:DUF1344 domain-containing protein [Pararhizobium sp. IMCC21322]
MKKIVTIALASVAMISTAFAGAVEGVVKAVDPANATVELETGEMFTVTEEIELEGLEVGTMVNVMFTDGTSEATEISIIE